MTETEREDIETILDEFDFCKVEKVMQALDWKWVQTNNAVPSIGDMRRMARELLGRAVLDCGESTDWATSCGGFVAQVHQYPGNSKKYISLSFQVAEWNNHD